MKFIRETIDLEINMSVRPHRTQPILMKPLMLITPSSYQNYMESGKSSKRLLSCWTWTTAVIQMSTVFISVCKEIPFIFRNPYRKSKWGRPDSDQPGFFCVLSSHSSEKSRDFYHNQGIRLLNCRMRYYLPPDPPITNKGQVGSLN